MKDVKIIQVEQQRLYITDKLKNQLKIYLEAGYIINSHTTTTYDGIIVHTVILVKSNES